MSPIAIRHLPPKHSKCIREVTYALEVIQNQGLNIIRGFMLPNWEAGKRPIFWCSPDTFSLGLTNDMSQLWNIYWISIWVSAWILIWAILWSKLCFILLPEPWLMDTRYGWDTGDQYAEAKSDYRGRSNSGWRYKGHKTPWPLVFIFMEFPLRHHCFKTAYSKFPKKIKRSYSVFTSNASYNLASQSAFIVRFLTIKNYINPKYWI